MNRTRLLAGAALLVTTLSTGAAGRTSAATLPAAGSTWSDTWNIAASMTMTADDDRDFPPAVDLVGGDTLFNWTSTVCAGASDWDGIPTVTEAGACSVSGHGAYSNIVCGTGTASANLNSTGLDQGTGNISVVFVLGIGVLTGTFTDTSSAGDDADTTDTLSGFVVLGPPVPPGAPGDSLDCAESFTWNMVVFGTE